MNTRISHHLLFLVFLLLSNALFAQNYPVTCTPIVRPSYSLKWSEISTSSEMFKVHLLLKDLTKPSVDVYLKIRLSGVGVDIRSVDGFIPSQTIHLNPGSAMLLTSADLTEYFNISNLVVDGIDINAFYAGGRLPEGLYTWTVEAYEIDRNRQVSNTGMALMNVFKNYPPIINIPQEGAILPLTNPQNILFSWTSRSTASLNAAQGKTYKLRIYPLNAGEDPNMIANSGIQPIEITTTTPYFNYGAANIALEKGKRYAVQVQEEDINGPGGVPLDDYENEGKSQVVSFSFGKPCVAPEGLIINPIEKGRVELTWEQNDETSTTIWYKQKLNSVWNTLTVDGKNTVISNLKDKTAYEFKISSNCGANTNAFGALDNSNPVLGGPSSDIAEFIMDDSIFDEKIEELDRVAFHPAILDPFSIKVELLSDGTSVKPKSLADIFDKIIKPKCANDASSYKECSIDHPKVPIPTGEDLTSLVIGDVLGIYDYAVLVTEVGGGNAFSGKGLVKLPFLDGAFMPVEFSGIKIKKGEDGTHGGCVYEVPDAGYFRNRSMNQGELQNEQIKTIADIIKLTDSTIFHGDLEATLLKYKEKGEEIATKGTATPQDKQDLLTFTKGIETAISTWKDKFTETFSNDSNPKLAEIMDDMKAIISQLKADKQTIENGNGYPIIPNLKEKIDAIIEKIKALQQEQIPALPKIQNVLATNINYNEATITWQGDPKFTKYVISYKTADGGELIETVNSNRLTLKNLQENSLYGFKIEGYIGNDIVDSYENGTFTTLQNKIPIPENVKQVKINDNALTLTWDKNKLHESYKVVFKNKNGFVGIIYPKTNTITLKDLVPDENYEYSIVAFGNNTESDPAKGDFPSNMCRGLIEATAMSIVEGTSITLTASPSCINNFSWGGGVPITNQRIINVTPNETTTYELSCTIEFKNGETKLCKDEVTITVDKKCTDVVARATTYDITQGEEVGLIVKGCSSDVIWKDEKLATVNTNKIWLNVPSKPQTYAVYCKNTEGNACAFQLPTINIKCQIKLLENDNDADENVWGVPSGSKMITLLGCENGIVDWDFSKEGQINGKEIKPNQFLISNIKRSREAKIKASCTRFGQKCETEELTITRPNVLCGEYAGSNPHTLSIEDGKIKIVSKWYNNEANANCSSIKWSDGTLSIFNKEVNHIKYFSMPAKPAVFEGIAFVYGSGDNNTRECPFNIPYNPVIKEVQDNIIPEVICTPFIASASKTNFDCDDKIQLSSKWCGVTETNTGMVTWEPTIPLSGIVTPTVKEITYKATCQFNGQTITSEVKLRRNPPKLFVGLSDKSSDELFYNNILAGKTISLQSWGCYNDNCQSGTVEYYFQYYSPNGQALGFNKVTNNSILINGTYRSIDFKAKCLISSAEATTKKFEIYVPNPCDFIVLVDAAHNNPPNVQDGLASIKISGCELGTLSWKNSKGGHGDINISTMKIEDNNSGSVVYQITCHLNGNVSTQPFCDKEVIIYRTETKPIITDETKCSDFFKEDTYTYKLSIASGVTGSEPTYTPKEKALFAGILTSSNEVQLRLASSNCPSNIVTWYDSDGKKVGDKNMITIAFPSKSPATYTSECSMITNNGNPLKCTSKVSITFNLDYIIELNKILKNGRVSTLQTTEISNTRQDNIVNETSENANCGFMTTQNAVGDILKNLICDNGKLVMENPVTAEKVEIIKNTILQQPIFQGINLPLITDEMISKITSSDESSCSTAIDGLVEDVKGTSLKEDFNTLATDPDLIDEVVENIQNNFAISLSNPDINTTPKTYKIGQYSVTFYIDVEKVDDYYQMNGKQYTPLYYAGSKGFIGFYDKDVLATITPNEKGEYPKGVLDSKGAWLLPSATTYKVESYQTLVETTIPTLQSDFLEPFATYWKALHKCTDTEFKAYEEGIVPECFWHGVGNPNFAQLAGLIDETYRTGVGFGKFTKPFNKIDDLLREYLLGITCEDELWDNIKKIDKLEDEIRKLNYDAEIINFVVEQWKNEQIETLAEDIAACDEYVNFKQKLPQFADIVLNWDTWATTFENLPNNIDKYIETFAKDLDNVGTLNDLQNYALGKRMFEVGSIFATAGGANAAEVGINTLKKLPKLPKNIPLRAIEHTATEIKVIAEGETTSLFTVNKEGVYTSERWFTGTGATTKLDEVTNIHFIDKGSSFKTGTIEFVEDANGEKWLKAITTASRYAKYPNIQKLATHVLDEVDNLADDLLSTLEADLAGNNALKTAFEEEVSLLDTWKKYRDNLNRKDAEWLKNVSVNGLKIPYNGDDLSKLVLEERKSTEIVVKGKTLIGDFGISNYAAYEYKDLIGQLRTVVRKSGYESGQAIHSEQYCEMFLQTQGIPKENILRIYTERSPCFGGQSNNCASRIKHSFPNAKVTYTWYYGDTDVNKSMKEFMEELAKLYQKLK